MGWMVVLLHVVIACVSLLYTGYVCFAPSKRKLRLSYVLIAFTIVTGIYLVATTHVGILRVCTTGLAYLAVALAGNAIAHRRLARQESDS